MRYRDPVSQSSLSSTRTAERGFIWEQGCDAGASFDFLVLSFEHVGGPHAFAMVCRYLVNRETFRDVVLGPSCQLRCGVLIGFDEQAEFSLRCVGVFGGEDA